MYRRAFLASLAPPVLLAGCGTPLGPLQYANTMDGTLIVLRHAERDGDGAPRRASGDAGGAGL